MARIVNLKTKGNIKLSKYSLGVCRVGMLAYGHEFYNIALKTRRSPVRPYLLGHAIELFLKSYLMEKGYDIKNLKGRQYGHNIAKLLDESQQNGLDKHFNISVQLKSDIATFSDLYSSKEYEYFPILAWLFRQRAFDTKRLFRFAKQLDNKLPDLIRSN